MSTLATPQKIPLAHPVPATRDSASHSQRRFLAGFLTACLGTLVAVLAFNAVIDPYALAGTGVVPTAVESDRSIKLDLIQHLERGPQLLIMGSSRSRQAEPSYLQKLTGLSGFNAGVTGGTSADEYVFARFAADLFPHQRRHYIWFTDIGLAGGGVLPQLAQDQRARHYLSRRRPLWAGRHEDVPQHRRDQGRVARLREVRPRELPLAHPLPRGWVAHTPVAPLPTRARDLAPELGREGNRRRPRASRDARTSARRPDAAGTVLLLRARARVHEQPRRGAGARAEPRVSDGAHDPEHLRFSRPAATLEMVARLHRRFRFVFVDAEDIRTWGGNRATGRTRRTSTAATCARCSATSSPTRTARCAEAEPCCSTATASCSASCPASSSAGGASRAGGALRLAFLTGASWFFYAWWDWRFLPVLILATSVDYVAGLWIARTEIERAAALLLAASLTTNIGILAYFKYAGFFLGSLDGIGRAVGLGAPLPSLHVVLPIGISFYTFNSMSYTIDVFRRTDRADARACSSTRRSSSLFPHLIAGPIVRFTDLAGQLRRLTPTAHGGAGVARRSSSSPAAS